MAVHACLKNEFTEDEKYHNLMSWLILCIIAHERDFNKCVESYIMKMSRVGKVFMTLAQFSRSRKQLQLVNKRVDRNQTCTDNTLSRVLNMIKSVTLT